MIIANVLKVFGLLLSIAVIAGCGSSGGSSDEPPSTSENSTQNTTQGSGLNTDSSAHQTESQVLSQAAQNSPLKPYFGSWIYAHDGVELYITSNTQMNFIEIDENLLEVDDNGISKYLIRNGNKNINVKGRVKDISQGSAGSSRKSTRGLSGIGGINFILSNIADQNIAATAETDSGGNFNVVDLPAGTYNVSAGNEEVGVQTQITLVESSENIGEIVLASDKTNNFKTELFMNEDFVYADGNTYSGFVRVHNMSKVAGVGLSYNISLLDHSLKAFNFTKVLGSIPAKSYKDIPISMSFNPFKLNERKFTIHTLIRDIHYKEWNDQLFIKVYRDKLRINFKSSQSSIKGYISLPNQKQKIIDIHEGYIEVPYTIDNNYIIALANPYLSNETAYSIGFEIAADDTDNFYDTGKYEAQNVNESGAIVINEGKSITSYLHVGDIDFYRLNMDETADLFEDVKDALVNESYLSNPIAITGDILSHGDIASVDSGTLYINDIDVGQSAIIHINDILTDALTSSQNLEDTVKSTLHIGNISSVYAITTAEPDSTVSGFSFKPIYDAFPGAEYISNKIQVSGINVEVNASVYDGTLIINDIDTGQYSADVKNGDTLRIKAQSPLDFSSTRTTTVSIGDVSQDFDISTVDKDDVVSEFEFSSVKDAFPGTQYISNAISIAGINTHVSANTNNGTLIVNDVDLKADSAYVNEGDTLRIKTLSSLDFGTTKETVLTIGEQSQVFNITTEELDATITSFNMVNIENALPGVSYTSNSINIEGINDIVDVSTTRGALIVNGVDLNTGSSTVREGDILAVKVSSPLSFNDANSTILSIGDQQRSFNISTRGKLFDDIINANLSSTLYSSDFKIPVDDINVSISDGVLVRNDIELTDLYATANTGDVFKVKVVSSNEFLTTINTTVTIGNGESIFSITTEAEDTLVSDFIIDEIIDAYPDQQYISKPIIVSGINTSVSAKTSQGTFIVNDQDVNVSNTLLNEGDIIRIKIQSPVNFDSESTTLITIGDYTQPFKISTVIEDSSVDSFKFESVVDTSIDTEHISNLISISGINTNVIATTSLGTLIINGIDLNVASALVKEGDTLRVKTKSSSELSASLTATITIGDKAQSFNISTIEKDETIQSFVLNSVVDAYPNIIYISNEISIEGINTEITMTASEGTLIINDIDTNVSNAQVTEGDLVRVKVLSRSGYSQSITSRVTIGSLEQEFRIVTIEEDTIISEWKEGVLGNQPLPEYVSSEIKIAGIDSGVIVTTSVGTLIVNDIAINVNSALVKEGDRLRVKTLTPLGTGSSHSTKITIGEVEKEIELHKDDVLMKKEDYLFNPVEGAQINTQYVSNAIKITGINTKITAVIEGGKGTLIINGSHNYLKRSFVMNGDTLSIKAESSSDYESTSEVVLSIGDNIKTFILSTRKKFFDDVVGAKMYGRSKLNTVFTKTNSNIIFNSGCLMTRDGIYVGDTIYTGSLFDGQNKQASAYINSEVILSCPASEIPGGSLSYKVSVNGLSETLRVTTELNSYPHLMNTVYQIKYPFWNLVMTDDGIVEITLGSPESSTVNFYSEDMVEISGDSGFFSLRKGIYVLKTNNIHENSFGNYFKVFSPRVMESTREPTRKISVTKIPQTIENKSYFPDYIYVTVPAGYNLKVENRDSGSELNTLYALDFKTIISSGNSIRHFVNQDSTYILRVSGKTLSYVSVE